MDGNPIDDAQGPTDEGFVKSGDEVVEIAEIAYDKEEVQLTVCVSNALSGEVLWQRTEKAGARIQDVKRELGLTEWDKLLFEGNIMGDAETLDSIYELSGGGNHVLELSFVHGVHPLRRTLQEYYAAKQSGDEDKLCKKQPIITSRQQRNLN
jgi:hypothetical protein